MPAALDPDYVSVEERTAGDLLKFAGEYAKYLRFFDETNRPCGDWSGLFGFNDAELKEIAAFVEDPEAFQDDEKRLRRFSSPHLVLFLAFLKLLRHPQNQFNDLTRRHLDFYYKDVLKLKEKPATPDKVHVIFELSKGVDEHLVNKGTLLSAGKDSEGIDLCYATDEDIVVNRAQVASLKSVYVKKMYMGLRDIHNQYDKNDEGFEKTLRWAVGRPNRGDELPAWPDGGEQGAPVDIEYLKKLYLDVKDIDTESIDQEIKSYILLQLCFADLEDFRYCMGIHIREMDSHKGKPGAATPSESEWDHVYERIEKAYRKNINRKRREALRKEREDPKHGDDKDAAFKSMIEFALGDPNPGDPLPAMPRDTLEDLLKDIDDETVAQYVKETLCMSAEDFRKIMEIKDSGEPDWEELYRLMVKAQVKKRKLIYPPIGREEVQNVYATSAFETEHGEPKRFKTFTGIPETDAPPATGFAVASPILLLREGERTITLTLACKEGTFNREILENILGKNISPFEISLSSGDKWIKLDSPEINVGDFIIEDAIETYAKKELSLVPTSKSSSLLCTVRKSTIKRGDKDKYIVSTDGTTYKITDIIESEDEQQVKLESVGKAQKIDAIKKCGIYPNSLQFRLTIDKAAPAISPAEAGGSSHDIDTSYPILKIVLRNFPKDGSRKESISHYEQFKRIILEKINIRVDVNDLQDLQLRNDGSVLSPKSPFEPFGSAPKPGSGFYIGNSEICGKRLDSLSFKIDWMGLPKDFKEHYKAYSVFGLVEPPIQNTSFNAQLKLLINRSREEIESPKPLFNSKLENLVSLDYTGFDKPGYDIDLSLIETDDPLEMPRYFKLELASPDFQHDAYPIVLNEVALAKAKPEETRNDKEKKIHSLTVYPAYTPKIKAISLDYTSCAEIDLYDEKAVEKNKTGADKLFQLHPFGYVDILDTPFEREPTPGRSGREGTENGYCLMPQYDQEGYLYIGLSDLRPPQNISIPFQPVVGSGDPGLKNPEIKWSYLSENFWKDFQNTEVLSDGTNGLLDAGIIRLMVPEKANDSNTLMPGDMRWLRAAVQENGAAVPDTLDIKTQAVCATFKDQGNAPDHLMMPLASDTIKGPEERDPAIKAIRQPYSSFKGKMREAGRVFYTRVSERLRHKQRALTAWDYERIVLENFPSIYNVKCLNGIEQNQIDQESNASSADVTVVVIPDIADTAPFFPLEPKAPLYLLKEIEDYLKACTSPFIRLTVKNPRYERIKYRVGIRLKQGYDQGYYLRQLNEEIKEFLSPWAYRKHAEISFGSSIHSSTVIHFIETREYVDYAANLKLIEQVAIDEGGKDSEEPSYHVSVSSLAQVKHPDAILVSSSEHIIDLITREMYEEEDFEGIGYMIIEIDFEISPPDATFDSIGYMSIGEDFTIY